MLSNCINENNLYFEITLKISIFRFVTYMYENLNLPYLSPFIDKNNQHILIYKFALFFNQNIYFHILYHINKKNI